MKLTGENRSTRGGKTCPSATLPTTNLTWTDPGSNPGLCGERPATNLSTSYLIVVFSTYIRASKCSFSKRYFQASINRRRSKSIAICATGLVKLHKQL
jgi:hypothetical protein